MILITCTTCGFGLQVDGDELEMQSLVGDLSDFFPNKYPCANPKACNGVGHLFEPGQISPRAMSQMQIIEVTPHEAFAALNGLGLPNERSCYLEDIREMFKVGVKNIDGSDILGTSRCLINHIELNDGTRVYLGASADGATVYRVTRAASYVKNVEEGSDV